MSNPNADREEEAYARGSESAYTSIAAYCARGLGIVNPVIETARLKEERSQAIDVLRMVCEEFGDNDWSRDLHLSDIIEKHLYRNLKGG